MEPMVGARLNGFAIRALPSDKDCEGHQVAMAFPCNPPEQSTGQPINDIIDKAGDAEKRSSKNSSKEILRLSR
jgi:hypothetical protein